MLLDFQPYLQKSHHHEAKVESNKFIFCLEEQKKSTVLWVGVEQNGSSESLLKCFVCLSLKWDILSVCMDSDKFDVKKEKNWNLLRVYFFYKQ